MRRISIVLLTLALFVTAFVGPAAAQVLRVGSDVDYPPFEYVEEGTGNYVGFDMEIIREVGKRMGMNFEITNTAWDGIIPGLVASHYDVIIYAMTITDERAMAVDFSDPYFATGQVIAVRADDDRIQEPADLAGKVIAVQLGTTGDFAASAIEGATVDRFPSTPEAFLNVKQRRADAAVVDEVTAIEEARANPGQSKVVGAPFTIEYYGIAVKKGRADLLRDINRALASMKADGTYDELYAEWIEGQ